MKTKAFFIASSMAFALCAHGQNTNTIPNLDLEEDTTEVTTVSDIVKMQQKVISNNAAETHYNNVWKRRSFFNFVYNTTTMESDDEDHKFESDWGAGIQSGTNYRLHKKPIQKMVSINLDYTWLDLSANHFKAKPIKDENGKDYCYDSSDKNGEYYKIPWNLEKYEASYSMTLGPSITIAPFVPLGIKELDYIKLQAYYHIGYNVSFVYMVNDKNMDKNSDGTDYKNMANSQKFLWGHGLTNTFGFNLSWRRIGIGYERRTAKAKYKNISTDDFGKDQIDFTNNTSRIYITIRT